MRTRSKALIVVAIAGLVVGTAAMAAPRRSGRRVSPGDLHGPGWHGDLSLRHAGTIRWFRVYVPRHLPPEPAVVVLLHGGTQSMRKIFRPNAGATRGWPAVADREGFLLLVPNGVNPATGDPFGDDQVWNDCRGDAGAADSGADDVGFIAALVDWAEGTYDIDEDRVYVTGASNGGQMSYRLALELGDRVAAITAFIASWAAVPECGPPSRPVPVMIVNGTADAYQPWDGGTVPGNRGTVISAAATLDLWLEINRADPVPIESRDLPNRSWFDGCSLHLDRYEGAAEVVFVTVEGGGHTMPTLEYPVPSWILSLGGFGRQNRDVEGAAFAWDFLERHSLPG